MSLTSSPRSSSAMASGLPDAALGTVSPGRDEDLPVPAQEMCVHAQGLMTTRGGQGPRDDGPVPVAFCMPRRHRPPELHCFRRSIPRLYAPLSTLRVLPRGSIPRMTRGQCGSLLLHCNGLSPSTSCRSSRRTAAGLYAPLPTHRQRPRGRLRTDRGRRGLLLLHRSGLSPHTPCQSPGALTRVWACTLALSPIRDTPTEGFSHFVTSMTAPIASGWSGCRVGLAPTGKRR